LANLIITIISIALVGVAVAMAAYFGGQALQNGKYQAYAAAIISESQQLYLTDTQYMLDHGLSSFSDFGPDAPVIGNYTTGRVPIMGLDAFGSNGTYDSTGTIYAAPNTNTVYQTTCNASNTLPQLDGSYIYAARGNTTINGVNVILYNITAQTNSSDCNLFNNGQDVSSASSVNNVLVQICKAINAQMPPPADVAYYTYSGGLPNLQVSGDGNWPNYATHNLGNAALSTGLNYCYYAGLVTGISYPQAIIFAFSN
jgi:hypothetical protein